VTKVQALTCHASILAKRTPRSYVEERLSARAWLMLKYTLLAKKNLRAYSLSKIGWTQPEFLSTALSGVALMARSPTQRKTTLEWSSTTKDVSSGRSPVCPLLKAKICKTRFRRDKHTQFS